MRHLSHQYKVSFKLISENYDNNITTYGSACYGQLYNKTIRSKNVIILSDFLTEETKDFSRVYIKRLAKICNVKVKFINENEISLTGFKNTFYVKVFTTLFRMLFECYTHYSDGIEEYVKKTINFFNQYVKDRNKSEYKDMLERLIYYYSKNECFNGNDHGINRYDNTALKIKKISDLHNYKCSDDSNLQSFFC